MLPLLNESQENWLEAVAEVPGSILNVGEGKKPAPITFVLGAGASLSSGGPGTAEILLACRRRWPRKFPTDASVYANFTDKLTTVDREALMRPLFEEIEEAFVGYRCLAAIAQSRPVIVVNLNWDNCVALAAERIGVPIRSFDLKDVAEGEKALRSIRGRGRGIACAHVHGFLDNPNKDYGIRVRFAHSQTSAFAPEEFKLLKKLLAPLTVIAGTSLEGPGDVRALLKALRPTRGKAHPVWVFERGPHRPRGVLRRESHLHASLLKTLVERSSLDNSLSNPDIDFDALLTTLRGELANLPWSAINDEAEGRLPDLSKLIPPDPERVRSLLDTDRALVVGAPRVGASTLAYLVAWWRCLTDPRDRAPHVKGFRRPEDALKYLSNPDDDIGALVLDNLFDERDPQDDETESLRNELAAALQALDNSKAVVATASPDGTTGALCRPPKSSGATNKRKRDSKASLAAMLSRFVVQAGTLWRRDDLRAWARARGGTQAELVCREIRMGLITTPSQAVRRFNNQIPYELEDSWRSRLRAHVDAVCKHNKKEGVLLALLRLQDFAIPSSAQSLADLADVPVETVIGDPWGLCAPIRVDGELYLRLSHPGVVSVLDDWLEDNVDAEIEPSLTAFGEPGHWAVVALHRWRVYRGIGDGLEVPKGFEWADLELFGSEFVARAMHRRRSDSALDALERMWHCAPDHWSVKDVALDLARHWDALRSQRGRDLRDEILAADERFGTYALLEALLHVGRPAPIELWDRVAARLADMADAVGEGSSDPLIRRQVALALDAVLWRRCPVNHEEAEKLVRPMIEATEHDGLLHAAVSAASAYHLDGYRRLTKEGFKPPLINGSAVSLDRAREMAWLIAWHFVLQSRCRAVVSRRTFQSTLDALLRDDTPRYLDRSRRQNPLDAEHKRAVVSLAKALARYPETAGWGIHMVMNVHATTGSFGLPGSLSAMFSENLNRQQPDPGTVSAALTYMPAEDTRVLLEPILEDDKDKGRIALQNGLGRGVPVETTDQGDITRVVGPRFAMGLDPMKTRKRWGAGPKSLPRGLTIESLIESISGVVEEAVAEKRVERAAAIEAIARLRRGETWPIEVISRDRNLDSQAHLSSQAGLIALLKSTCDQFRIYDEK
jgi:hypothetical protein